MDRKLGTLQSECQIRVTWSLFFFLGMWIRLSINEPLIKEISIEWCVANTSILIQLQSTFGIEMFRKKITFVPDFKLNLRGGIPKCIKEIALSLSRIICQNFIYTIIGTTVTWKLSKNYFIGREAVWVLWEKNYSASSLFLESVENIIDQKAVHAWNLKPFSVINKKIKIFRSCVCSIVKLQKPSCKFPMICCCPDVLS